MLFLVVKHSILFRRLLRKISPRNDKDFRKSFLANSSFLIALFLVSSFTISCSNNPKIELKTLAKTYVDLLVVEDFYVDSDSLEIKKAEVFRNNGIDTSSYFSSFKSIKTDNEKWDEFFNLANTYLDSLKAELKETSGPIKSPSQL